MPANYIRILSSVLIKMLLSNLLICSGWSTEVTFHRVTDQTLYTGCTGTPNIFHLGPLSHNVGAPNMFQSNAILGVGGLGQSWLAKGHRSEHGHHSNSHWHVWETLLYSSLIIQVSDKWKRTTKCQLVTIKMMVAVNWPTNMFSYTGQIFGCTCSKTHCCTFNHS